MTSPRVEAVVKAIREIEPFEPEKYGGGWRNEIGTALVDAVFSIRAKYNAADPTKGVAGRVRQFREEYPGAKDNLSVLAELDEAALREVMGNTVSGGRPKSVCVVEAAQAMTDLDPAVITAADGLGTEPAKLKAAYTSVKGLGSITAEYFLMHLGIQGVKADRMIVRFVNRALTTAGLDPVKHWSEARDLVIAAYQIDPRGAESLNAFEHAIWRYESARALSEGEEDNDQDNLEDDN